MKNLIATLVFVSLPFFLFSQGKIDGNAYTFHVKLSSSEICLDGVLSAGPFTFSKEVGCIKIKKLNGDDWHKIVDIGNLDFFIHYRPEKKTYGIKATWKGNELSGWRINIYQDGSIKEKGDFRSALENRISVYGL